MTCQWKNSECSTKNGNVAVCDEIREEALRRQVLSNRRGTIEPLSVRRAKRASKISLSEVARRFLEELGETRLVLFNAIFVRT